jgi:hypothetical protein
MRVNGSFEANFPIVLLDSHPITISFDVDGRSPENLHIKILHCDKNWNITQTSFVNDEYKNITRNQIPFKEAPIGVSHYRWTYSLNIPESGGKNTERIADFERLSFSGNYKFEVWSEDQNELLAEGKFFAAEKTDNSLMIIDNRYLPSEVSPQNQVNKAVLSFSIPASQQNAADPIYSNYIKTIDVYRNREIEYPNRIDVDDQSVNTFIEGYGTNDLKYMIDNLQPGNEYRHIDFRDPGIYPPDVVLHRRDGADLGRWRWQGEKDSNGTSILVVNNRYADYLQYLFELIRPEGNTDEKIYIVGDFNGWKINERWRLQYDDVTKQYTLLTWLRRGAYDYQYVLDGNDWITLEGNDWRTVNVYTAFLYYHDVRFGGFDRILLAAQRKSPGGMEATTR